jgi:hypothetical protein
MVDGDDLYGDGVDVAAWLEGEARQAASDFARRLGDEQAVPHHIRFGSDSEGTASPRSCPLSPWKRTRLRS